MFKAKFLISISVFFIIYQANAQNLVPNSSFENAINLPCDYIQNFDQFNNSMQNWIMPTRATSDIYSTLTPITCALSCFSTNQFSYGKRTPRTGNNMCGFILYEDDFLYREYLQVQLTSPLIVGNTYYAEMYVSNARFSPYGCNNIGMHFSTNPVSLFESDELSLSYIPQIKSYSIIIDTIEWVKISGTFVANTASEYLIIGNFDNQINTSTVKKFDSDNSTAYYYIDDVLVKDTIICVKKDTSQFMCLGETITLNISQNNVESWSLANSTDIFMLNSSSIDVSPKTTTTYLAHHLCGGVSSFEVIVDNPPSMPNKIDTVLCSTEKLVFDMTTNDASYLWHNGTTSPIYEITDIGSYSVTIKNICGAYTKQITVNPCCDITKIPNLITPNGDGLNDTFNIGCLGNGDYEVNIYNAWGSLIFHNKSYKNDWSDNILADSVYYYEIKKDAKNIYNGWLHVAK